jgi:hypothetical protein
MAYDLIGNAGAWWESEGIVTLTPLRLFEPALNGSVSRALPFYYVDCFLSVSWDSSDKVRYGYQEDFEVLTMRMRRAFVTILEDGYDGFTLDLDSTRWSTHADQMEHVIPTLARMVYKALYHVNSTKVIKVFLKQTPELTELFFHEYTREIARHEAYLEQNEGGSSVGYFTTPDNREVSYKANMHASPPFASPFWGDNSGARGNSTGLSHNSGELPEEGSASAEEKDASRQRLEAQNARDLRERQQRLEDQINEEEVLRLQFEALRKERFESEAKARDARMAEMRQQIAEEQKLVESGRSGQHSTLSASPFQGRTGTQ